MGAHAGGRCRCGGGRVVRPGAALLACVLAGCGLAAVAQAVEEAELDEELLEFLGSFDGLDEDWMAYLERTDVAKITRGKPVASPPREAPREAPEVRKP